MTTPRAEDDLTLALTLADAADAISLPRFGAADLVVESKPDMTPVTDADRDVERALRDLVARHRPGDAVIGEEFGTGTGQDAGVDRDRHDAAPDRAGTGTGHDAVPGPDPSGRWGTGRCWVFDPIDGTKNFVRGVPIWATLIALLVDGVPAVGVVSAPALMRRWWGSAGSGAWTRFASRADRACRVSGVSQISDASLSIAQPRAWEDAGRGEAARRLSRRAWRTRGYGDFYSYMLVAEGAVDVAGEPELSLWDLAALGPIVIAAGGSFTDADGAPIGPGSRSALATNGLLHAEALTALAGR